MRKSPASLTLRAPTLYDPSQVAISIAHTPDPRVPYRVRYLSCTGLLSICFLSLGCTGKTEQPPEIKSLQTLATMYGRYRSAHRGTAPPDEASLKKFISGLSPTEQTGLGIDPANLDKMFTSPRDGQPFVVVYKSPGAVIAYEQVGKNGKHLVAYPEGKVEEVDEARFKELVPGAK